MSEYADLLGIAATIYRYSTAMDSRQWHLMDDVFIADATVDMGGQMFARGRTHIVAIIRAAIECCSLTHHTNTNIEAVIDGDTARVTNQFRAWHRGKGPTERLTYEALGNYTDEFVRGAEGWRIRSRLERNPIEIWNGAGDTGSQQIFFANAMQVFARYAIPRA